MKALSYISVILAITSRTVHSFHPTSITNRALPQTGVSRDVFVAASSLDFDFSIGKKVEDPSRAANLLLLEWLESNGVYISENSGWGDAPHPLALSSETRDEDSLEFSGRGLVFRKPVSDGDKLIDLPFSLCMTKEASQNTFGKSAITDGTSEYIAIALLLIHERYTLGEASFWWPYINILPETSEVNPSFTWTEEELKLLEGSPALVSALSLRAKVEGEYDTLRQGIFARHAQTFDPEEVYTYERFEWAFTMLFSRAVRLDALAEGPQVALVPYADLVNHTPFSTAYITAEVGADGWFGQKDEDKVVVIADRSFKAMEQFYISYGQKSNAELLLLYGFSLDRNPFNSVEISVGLAPGDSLYDEKLEFIKNSGQGLPDGTGFTFPLYIDRYPNELLECLRVLCITSEELTRPDGSRAALSNLQATMFVSEENEVNVFEALIEACQATLDRYPNSEKDDAALMKDRSMFTILPMNTRNAIRLRRTEKRLLRRTIATAERRIEELRSGDLELEGLDLTIPNKKFIIDDLISPGAQSWLQ